MVEIREIAKEDMKAMVALLRDEEMSAARCIVRSGLFKMYDQMLTHDNNWVLRMWVAFDGPHPVGIASIEKPDYHNKEILNLYVNPDYRRQGLGDQLVVLAKASGILFDVYYTPTSKSLYSRHGFCKYLRNFAA
jgi:ribosomal protein S18 acetylase RimI-like enzyme